MSAILQAIATSGVLMLGVLVIVTLASIAAHNRGETAGHQDAATDSTEGSSGLGFAFGPDRDPLVLEILGLGALLFGIAMALLLGVSMLNQM